MSLAHLPAELIAHISTYLEYCDMCNLKESNRHSYTAISGYGKYKIRLEKLALFNYCGVLSLEANTTMKKYSFKSLNLWEESTLQKIQWVLNECTSIDNLLFCKIYLTTDLLNHLMETKINIKSISVSSDQMLITSIDLLQLCGKVGKVVCSHEHFDPAIWNDDVLTKLLPNSSIIRETFWPMENSTTPWSITDCTLNALFGEKTITNDFCIRGVQTSISVDAIVKAIKILDNRKVFYLSWDLGILQSDQLAEAEHYFKKKTGELRPFCSIHENVYNGFHVYMIESRLSAKFRVKFCVILP